MAGSGFSENPQAQYDAEAEPQSVARVRLRIDKAGRIVIPAEMRMAMLVKPGDAVTAQVVDGELMIMSPPVAIRRVQAWARAVIPPGVDIVEELIKDRREEARKEAEEADEWRRARGLPPLE